jgi:phospholipase/lecithinase/hemolysin
MQLWSSMCGWNEKRRAQLAAIVLVAAAPIVSVAPATAQPFNQVIVFGDSNVDTGYYRALSTPQPGAGAGSAFSPTNWANAVAAGAGAPTTNPDPGKAQFLASYFGLTANPSNQGGTNYATSGAKNLVPASTATGGFLASVPTVTQISNYLTSTGGTANPSALYLVFSGDNDVNHANGELGTGPYPPDPTAYVTQAAVDLANSIQTLRAAGAQKIIVVELASSFPGGGAGAAKRALRLAYNNSLFGRLDTLTVPYRRAGHNALRVAINTAPAKYGFTFVSNVAGQVACTDPGNAGDNFALVCSSNPAAPSKWVDATAPFTRLFADEGGHLATSGQRLFANMFYNLVIPATVTHDFDGNAKSDILWRQNDGVLAMWLMNGPAVASSASVGAVPTAWHVVAQRDFNGDSRADIVWRHDNGDLAIWFMNGPTVVGSLAGLNVPPTWQIVGTGDFNADHRADLLWRDGSGNTAMYLIDNGIIGSASYGVIPPSWSVRATSDFDGDGKADILWHDSSGAVALWFMFGTTVQSTAAIANVPPPWSIVASGDFNGDGKADILWRNTTTGDVAMWLMNGSAVAGTAAVANIPTTWTIVETGDFNGDGKSDILWRDNTGNTAIWFMNGTAIASSAAIGNVPMTWNIENTNSN